MGAVGEGSCTCNKTYVTAGEVLTSGSPLEFTFTVGATGISVGGSVDFNLPAGGFPETGHTDCFDPWDASHSSVEVRDHLGNLLSTPTNYTVAYYGNYIRVRVTFVTAVQSGATVKARYWGQVTRVASQYLDDGVLRPVIASCQLSGSSCFSAGFEKPNCRLPFESIQGFEVYNGSLAKFLVVVPMVLVWEGSRSEEFTLAVVALDSFANPVANPAYTGTITLESDETWQVDGDEPAASREVTFTSGEQGIKVINHVRFTSRPASDFAWIEADLAGVGSVSNPASLEDNPTLRVLVADLHVHPTNDHMAGNFATPDQVCLFGRDVARLDGICVIEHAEIYDDDERYTPEEQYERQRTAALAYTGDKFFVLQGFEWTQSDDVDASEGNVNHHLWACFPIQLGEYNSGFGKWLNTNEAMLVEKLKSIGHDGILWPHVMHGRKRFDLEHAPFSNEPIAEIVSYKTSFHHDKGSGDVTYVPQVWPRGFEVPGYDPDWTPANDSTHRTDRYRHTLRYAWSQRENNRKKWGIVGSSDCHIGKPGTPNWDGWGNGVSGASYGYQRPGLAMVLATAKDSCGCFRALQAKRCFATSGVRIYVDFQVRNAGGTYSLQGGTLELAAGSHDFEISLRVACPRNIKLLEVYRYDPANPTAGDFGDGYRTVKQYADVGARSLEVTLTKDEAALLGSVPVDSGPNDYFLFYLFVQQDEGSYAGNAAWSSPVFVEKL
jgi:hypothetical protein